MSPLRALNLTTSAHPYAFAIYAMQLVLGVLLIAGVIGIESMEGLLLLPVVGAIMAAGGGVGLFSIIATHREPVHKSPAMRLEQIAAWAIAAVNAFFTAALCFFYGWNVAVPTKVYVCGIAAGCGFRAWQIAAQRKRLRVAIAALVPAEPQLAERRDPDQ